MTKTRDEERDQKRTRKGESLLPVILRGLAPLLPHTHSKKDKKMSRAEAVLGTAEFEELQAVRRQAEVKSPVQKSRQAWRPPLPPKAEGALPKEML